jgi:hypothetical protein
MRRVGRHSRRGIMVVFGFDDFQGPVLAGKRFPGGNQSPSSKWTIDLGRSGLATRFVQNRATIMVRSITVDIDVFAWV